MSEYYSPQEIADRLSVSVYTIRRYIRAGKLRAVKLEGTYRVSREDLTAFLRSRQIGDPTDGRPDESEAGGESRGEAPGGRAASSEEAPDDDPSSGGSATGPDPRDRSS